MFTSFTGEHVRRRVGVVGLGAGSIACYRRPGQEWTFYEIDPAVAKIASDPQYFTYLQECAPDARFVLGDGRRSLAAAPQGEYDLLILDAFSSDAVPIHLVTREAVALYLVKIGHERWFYAYVAIVIACSLIAYVRMKDTRDHGLIEE